MPRKKKEQAPDPGKPEGYEVLIGFVKRFKYADEESAASMRNHPLEGRCYRLIKDQRGYRVHIGQENNDRNYDGLILGDKLKDKKQLFSFHIEVVTPDNYLDLGLTQEDTLKVVEWLSTDNADLWASIRKEVAGEEQIIQQLQAVLDFKEELEKRQEQVEKVEHEVSIETPSIAIATILSASLNTISEKEPEAFMALFEVIEYIASTYNDKYEGSGMPNVSKSVLLNSEVGKAASIWNVMKYAQRYLSTGYEKSNNVKDIFKIIHYSLFEIQRRKRQDHA